MISITVIAKNSINTVLHETVTQTIHIANYAHTFGDYQITETKHSRSCTACGYTESAEHNCESATCENAAVCTTCGTVVENAKGNSYQAVITKPTCTEQGYTTYSCYCGDSYIDNFIDALGHNDQNSDGRCDACQNLVISSGDINCDSIMDIKDAAILQRHILKIDLLTDESILIIADVTKDGIVDMKDAAKLTRYVIKVIGSLNNVS